MCTKQFTMLKIYENEMYPESNLKFKIPCCYPSAEFELAPGLGASPRQVHDVP